MDSFWIILVSRIPQRNKFSLILKCWIYYMPNYVNRISSYGTLPIHLTWYHFICPSNSRGIWTSLFNFTGEFFQHWSSSHALTISSTITKSDLKYARQFQAKKALNLNKELINLIRFVIGRLKRPFRSFTNLWYDFFGSLLFGGCS